MRIGIPVILVITAFVPVAPIERGAALLGIDMTGTSPVMTGKE
ncbi:hypothetical protein [Microvirga sp. 3-52]|nr:hypothetical protein [Microvirga sp. 3-52]